MCLCVWFIVKNVYTRIGKLYISQKRIRNVMLKPSFQWASECGSFLSPVDKQKKENLLTKNKLIAKLTTIRSSVQYKSVSQATMGGKSVGHLVVKFKFWACWSHFSPSPLNNVDFFSISSTAQTTTSQLLLSLIVAMTEGLVKTGGRFWLKTNGGWEGNYQTT